MTQLMTVEQVADHLQVTKKTIYRLLTQGNIPATKIGKQWRFEKAAIDKWLKENSVKAKASILVVDDEEVTRALFKVSLEELGHRVTTAEDGLEGLELVKQQDFDLVFLDLKMPRMNGVELFNQIKTIKPKMPVVIITGYFDSDMMAKVLTQRPSGIMRKPFNVSDIVAMVNDSFRISTAEILR